MCGGVTSFEAMTDLAKELRTRSSDAYTLERPEIVTEQVSIDGTRKWLLRLPRARHETRAARDRDRLHPRRGPRHALHLEPGRLHAHLLVLPHRHPAAGAQPRPPREIVGQILLARDRIGDWPGDAADDGGLVPGRRSATITNVVLMGMGEPLYNFDNVRRRHDDRCRRRGHLAVASAASRCRRRASCRRSRALGREIGHDAGDLAARRARRAARRAGADQQEISDRRTARRLPRLSRPVERPAHHLRIRDAEGRQRQPRRRQALVRLLAGIPAKINLIPFNPWPGTHYECSDWEQIERFADVVNKAGYASPVSTPRGRDILAACGQLRSESVKLRAAERGTEAALQLRTGLAGGQARMFRALGRIIMVSLAALAAAAAGLFVLVTLGLERITRAAHGRTFDDDGIGTLFDFLRSGLHLAAAATILPALAVIVIGEVVRIRSLIYYVLGGGVALAAIPLVARLGHNADASALPI